MTTNRSLVALMIAVAVAPAALAGCAGDEPASAQASEPAPATPVRLAEVDRTPIRDRLVLPGLLAPRETYELSFLGGGMLAAIDVEEGDEVHAGQVLARIDGTAVRATHAQAREGLGRAERDLARTRSLSETGTLPTATFEDATTAAEMARSQLAVARFAIRHAALRAPDHGWIDARLADRGEVVGPGQPIVRVASASRGWVLRVAVPDRAVARLAIGHEAEVRLDALPERAIAARVVEIARLPASGGGTFDVELAFDPPEGITPRTGLVGRAAIPVGDPSGASVPLAALVDGRDHEAAVFTRDGDSARRRAVRIAFFTGDRAVIAEGLEGVDTVITAGADRLEDGARIVVSDDGPVASAAVEE